MIINMDKEKWYGWIQVSIRENLIINLFMGMGVTSGPTEENTLEAGEITKWTATANTLFQAANSTKASTKTI